MQTPLFIAEHHCHARGFIGRIIAKWMAFETAHANKQAIKMLDIRDGEKILDFGTGHGQSLKSINTLTPSGLTVGIDNSPIMIKEAAARNSAHLQNNQIQISQINGPSIPFENAYFDKAIMVHACYFLHPLETYLQEIKRTLKKGADFLICFQPRNCNQHNNQPNEVYRMRTSQEMKELLAQNGFELTEEKISQTKKSLVWLKVRNKG